MIYGLGGVVAEDVSAPPVCFQIPLPFSGCAFTSNRQHWQGEPEVPGISSSPRRALANDSWGRSITTPDSVLLVQTALRYDYLQNPHGVEPKLPCMGFCLMSTACFASFSSRALFPTPILVFCWQHFLINHFHMNPHPKVCFWGVHPETV